MLITLLNKSMNNSRATKRSFGIWAFIQLTVLMSRSDMCLQEWTRLNTSCIVLFLFLLQDNMCFSKYLHCKSLVHFCYSASSVSKQHISTYKYACIKKYRILQLCEITSVSVCPLMRCCIWTDVRTWWFLYTLKFNCYMSLLLLYQV